VTLAVRLWWIERKAATFRAGGGTLRPVLLIVVDSGLLYSAALFTALMCFVNGSNAQFILLDWVSTSSFVYLWRSEISPHTFHQITPIISISFYAVILRVALVQSDRERTTVTPKVNISSNSNSNSGQARSGSGYPNRSHISGQNSHHISIGANDGRYYSPTSRSMRDDIDDGYAMKPLRVDITREQTETVDAKPWE
jgi:hypothetical protein